MMKEEASTTKSACSIRVLPPLIIFVLISLGLVTIIIGKSSRFEELPWREVFPVLRDTSNLKQKQVITNTENSISSKQSARFDEETNHKSPDTFAWSNELHDWTLVEDKSKLFPDNSRKSCDRVWPEDCAESSDVSPLSSDDRIVDQLRLFDYQSGSCSSRDFVYDYSDNGKIFKILPPTHSSYPIGRELFLTEACPINGCSITYDREVADALIFDNSDVVVEPSKHRRINQIWIAYLLESPCHTFDRRFVRLHRGKHEFNWTASYRADSDLVTPYSRFVPFRHKVEEFNSFKSSTKKSVRESTTNFHRRFHDSSLSARLRNLNVSKRGKVAWFASNCNAANNRLEYARELANHIQVDIYGRCGNFTCDRWNQTGCLNMINREYKFYLSFENSNCRHYITEKLFQNALGYNDLNHLVLPIVMGAPQDDYLRFAPPGSFIHVDDFSSPKELARYLKQLDLDDDLYYSYFHWKTLGRFIDTKFMCRVCALLHESHRSPKLKVYTNIREWWMTCGNDRNDSCCQS